ncbi:hypothetical protein [Sulfurimonas sp. CS5]|jgi:predicted MPP superfamily phosphohydrolase|uniref:hypothetical protein n=1 Tax=Sulfurimonas sp. CS5 TaxID=3391145 RepID=UPI0039E89C53
MKINKLFKKAEKFFVLDESEQEKKEKKREKLKYSLEKKIASVKKKIKKAQDSDEKSALKKQLDVLVEFREKLE